MNFKRITIISGHYGSGKTHIAVNLATELKHQHEKVALADIDIVNPYFRSLDSKEYLESNGIRLICSKYANSNVDIPALPQDIYSVTDDSDMYSILDVGGDERGALALGRLSSAIAEEGNFDMLYVVNFYRPLTSNADSAIEVMREIENACHLKFTSIVNNSNLGRETTPEDVLSTVPLADELSCKTGLPVILNTVTDQLHESLCGKLPNIYPIRMQYKI